MLVCMHAYLYVCMHVCMYVCMYVCIHVCKCLCMYAVAYPGGGPGCSNTPLSVNSLIIHTLLLLALSSLDPRKHAGYYRNRALERPAIASLCTYSSKLID